jgi:hypothetical protein
MAVLFDCYLGSCLSTEATQFFFCGRLTGTGLRVSAVTSLEFFPASYVEVLNINNLYFTRRCNRNREFEPVIHHAMRAYRQLDVPLRPCICNVQRTHQQIFNSIPSLTCFLARSVDHVRSNARNTLLREIIL